MNPSSRTKSPGRRPSHPDLDARGTARVRSLLASRGSRNEIGERVVRFSAVFLGKPYRVSPLIGAADVPEVFALSLREFDCVTYVETVVALARSSSLAEFAAGVRELRYRGGKIGWRSRNHYMTEWLRRNVRRGSLAPLTLGAKRHWLDRRLAVVPGLPPRRGRFAYLKVAEVLARADQIPSGAVMLFVSTRAALDVFHCGIVIRGAGDCRLRHATRSRGRVIEEPLGEFLRRNRTRGLILAEVFPRERR